VGEIIELAGKGYSLYSYLRSKKTRDIAAGAVEARRFPELYDSLRTIYYDIPVLTGPGGPFPVGVLPLTSEAEENPEFLLGAIVDRPDYRPVMERRVIDAIKRRNATIWNGNTFSLNRLQVDSRGRANHLDAYIGSYFDMVCSADYLEYELLAALIHASFRPLGLEDLGARKDALSSAASPLLCLLSGGGVDAAIGISTLVVYRRQHEYWMMCEARLDLVAEYSDLYHVVPSFIFQPVVSVTAQNLKTEWSIKHNIFREYLEELFDVPEVQHSGRSVSADYFYGHPNLVYLRRLLADGRAQLSGVAMVFNLLSHRPEICTLLIIDDDAWFEDHKDRFAAGDRGLSYLCFNDEFRLNESQKTGSQLDTVTTLPIGDVRWAEIARPWSMVPPGAPAVVLGSRAACRKLGLEEPRWLASMTIDPARDPLSM